MPRQIMCHGSISHVELHGFIHSCYDNSWCHVSTSSDKLRCFTPPSQQIMVPLQPLSRKASRFHPLCCYRSWCYVNTHRDKSRDFTPSYRDKSCYHFSTFHDKLQFHPSVSRQIPYQYLPAARFVVSPIGVARYSAIPTKSRPTSREIVQIQVKLQKGSFLARELPKNPKKGSNGFQHSQKFQEYTEDQEKLVSISKNRKMLLQIRN